MEQNKATITVDKAILNKLQQIKKDMSKHYRDISNTATPELDSKGNKIVKTRPDGFDYLEEAYMRTKLDELFPGWSWEQGKVTLIGLEWIAVDGHLSIIDEYLLAFGIVPPTRKFFSTGAARIQFKQHMPHTPENVIDIDKTIKSANSNAFKAGINRLCRIGDDVYGKRVDDEGFTVEDLITTLESNDPIIRKILFDYLSTNKILHTKAWQRLGIKNWSEVIDWKEAYYKILKGGDA